MKFKYGWTVDMKAFFKAVKDFLTETAKLARFIIRTTFIALLAVFFLAIFFRENVQGAFDLFMGWM